MDLIPPAHKLFTNSLLNLTTWMRLPGFKMHQITVPVGYMGHRTSKGVDKTFLKNKKSISASEI